MRHNMMLGIQLVLLEQKFNPISSTSQFKSSTSHDVSNSSLEDHSLSWQSTTTIIEHASFTYTHTHTQTLSLNDVLNSCDDHEFRFKMWKCGSLLLAPQMPMNLIWMGHRRNSQTNSHLTFGTLAMVNMNIKPKNMCYKWYKHIYWVTSRHAQQMDTQ